MAMYEVELHSEPGMWEFYRFTKIVHADGYDDAIDTAKASLKRGAFPERPLNSWIVDEVRRIR